MKTVLFVCTGNTCRSPMAAAIFAELFKNCTVISAGLYADGSAYSQNAVKVLSEWGIDISGGVSRQLCENDLSADLIFCMNGSHRAALMNLGVPQNKITVLDVCDPYMGSEQVYAACRDELKEKLLEYKIKIREFTLSDTAAAACLEKECFSSPWSESAIADSFTAGTHFWVAENRDGVIGYAGLSVVLDEAYVTNIAVTEKWRGFGAGEGVLCAMCEYAEKQGCAFVSLEVRESNLAAISLYKKHGFKTAGKRKNFYSAPSEDALIMTKVMEK